ncbi:MAG: glycosyltransferase family 4 protein [Acidimicrobiales bacterium]|nr:glycosyltransferase family 4 protein [Acidimicrobiales bacterium]
MTHIFVTNDFPPKIGGIQTMLWELWRRLDPSTFVVLTTPHPDAAAWDATQPYRIVRTTQQVLLPTPGLRRQVEELAAEVGARHVVLDPALPVGLLGPQLRDLDHGIVVHGAEVTVPGRLPGTKQILGRVLRGAGLVVSAGGYPLAEATRAAGRPLPSVLVPPGVDTDRFVPLDGAERAATRTRLGLPVEGRLVVSVSRLVPRKGMDVLIRAASLLGPSRPDLTVAIGGTGRSHGGLQRLVDRTGAPVRLLGRVAHDDLPALYGSADVFAMLCRNRWAGLEQEGFGIVFLEAAAAGVPQVAGDSGGAAEAVVDGETGWVVRTPGEPAVVAEAIARLLDDPEAARRMGAAGRSRAAEGFSYDVLARRLGAALAAWEADARG